MPTEELKFEDLIKEYIDVIENTDVKKLKEKNDIMKVDIERKGKEAEGIETRIKEIQSELDSLNENSTVKFEYPEVIKDKEDKIQEAKALKDKKAKEIQKLTDKIKNNKKEITKVNNIGKDVIKRAEEKTNKENEELEKKIEKLEERKAKYGIKRIDKDGNEAIQLTQEENLVIDSIDKDIKKLNKGIKDNRKAFLLFKKTIEETKKDKEAFLALQKNMEEREETKTARKEGPEQTKPEQTKPEETKPEQTKPEQTKPEQTKPEQTKPEQTKPEQAKPEQTKPEQAKPEQTKPEQTKPEQTKPEQTKPEETKPEETKPEQTKPDLTKEWEITNIDISPIENKMSYRLENRKNKLERRKGEDTKGLKYNEHIEEAIAILKNNCSNYNINKIKKAIDPNILGLLAENSYEFKDGIKSYLDMLSGKESALTLNYSLKSIYKSDLSREEIKKIFKIAKSAKKLSKGSVEVEKDNIFERAYGNVRKMLGEYNKKRLEASYRKEENEQSDKEESILTKAKTKVEEKANNVKRYTSKKIDKTKGMLKKAHESFKIAGVRTTGFLTGENKLVTASKVRNIRGDFVPKAKVSEQAAVEKVESSKRNEQPAKESQTK